MWDGEIQRQRSRFSCWYAGRLDVSLALCVCLHLFVCVCLCPFVSDGLFPSVSRGLGVCVSFSFSGLRLSVYLTSTWCVNCLLCLVQCALESVVVVCWLGLPYPILSWFVLSCVVPSECHQSVCALSSVSLC